MASPFIAFRDVHYSYPQSAREVFAGATGLLPGGFSAIVGANGSGKSTLLKLFAGELPLQSGALEGFDAVVLCEQRTDHPPAQLGALLEDWEAEAFALRGRLGVPDDAGERWSTLSHGERKRVQLACALWQRPEILLLDEPTNHLDSDGVRLVREALEEFVRHGGVGGLVSHDRDLLDALCVQTLWIENANVLSYSGNFTSAVEQRATDQRTAQKTRDRLDATHRRLQAELHKRAEKASRADAARSKRGISAKDSDARERIDRARVTGKDGLAGKRKRQIERRAARSSDALAEAVIAKQHRTGVWLAGSISKADLLLRREAGSLLLGDSKTLRHPDLLMRPTDRIALTGPNGCGKSTMLRTLLATCALPEERVVVLPQEVSAEESAALLTAVRALPTQALGQVMSIVSRLGSRPSGVLDSVLPSPGEVRKLLLAMGILREPHLLVLDEPTNHLDVLAVEALEAALSECPCGLLMVSHDQRLLSNVTHTRWRIEAQSNTQAQLLVDV